MAKFDPPEDIDELKKHGGNSRHIVKRVSDSAARLSLDSDNEDEILDEWIRQTKPDYADIFNSYEGRYPSTDRLDEYVVVTKEVKLGNYRVDSVIRWPDGQADGRWTLVEVKTEAGLRPGVVGDLLIKEAIFKNIFTVRSEQVEKHLLSDGISNEFERPVNQIKEEYGAKIHMNEVSRE